MADQFVLPDLRAEIASHAQEWAEGLADVLRPYAPVAPLGGGRFRDSLAGASEETAVGADLHVVSDVPYAPFVIDDTVPHPIDPHRPPMALHFFVGGAEVFAGHVEHPGTMGQEFWDLAEDEIFDYLDAQVLAVLEAAP